MWEKRGGETEDTSDSSDVKKGTKTTDRQKNVGRKKRNT